MTHTIHLIVTNNEIEVYDRVADLAHAVHGLTMIARGMGKFEIHTIRINDTSKTMLEQLIFELDRKRAYLKANRDVMCKADIISENSNAIQLRDTIIARIMEAK